jgi:hypothetical protein
LDDAKTNRNDPILFHSKGVKVSAITFADAGILDNGNAVKLC